MVSSLMKANKIVEELDKGLNSSLYDLGFLKATIGNESVGEKISGSHSGHAMDVAIRAVIIKSLLFVTRSWDSNGDSIPRAIALLDGKAVEIEGQRKAKRPDWSDEMLEIGKVEENILSIASDANEFQNRSEFIAAKLHRDEHIAHLLRGKSGFNRKLQKLGVSVDPVTYNQVIELGEETAEFISRLIQICQFSIKNPKDWIDHSEKNTSKFWEFLPVLSEAEKSS